MSNTIRWEQDDTGVVTLVLDDPDASANTMNAAFVDSLAAVADRLEKEADSVRGVILTSAKKTFFAGGNLSDLFSARPEHAPQVLELCTTIKTNLRRIETLGKPTVAAIAGAALGGGLEIAMSCHHRVAIDNPRTKIGLPEAKLGLLPGGGGVVRSVRLLGLQTALMELLLQGKDYRPDKALELGLIDELATDEADLLAKARGFIDANPESVQRFDAKGYKVPGGKPSSPSLASVLPAFPANLSKQLKGAHYPAQHHIMCAAVEGLNVDVDTAFVIEGRYFVDLVVGQNSKNMIQAFWFDLNAVNGGASRPDGVQAAKASKVAVLGAGMMGAGIAHQLAKAGIDAVLKDVTLEAAEQGRAHVASLVGKSLARGSMTQQAHDEFLARIHPTAEAADLAGCDLVIEAVFESTELKHTVLAEAEKHVLPDAVLASNTSTLPITGLAAGVQRTDAVVGMHFFSPVHKMPLVELIVGEQTSDVALAKAYDVVRQIGKTPIVVADSRGFFTSRVFGQLVLEGASLLAEGLAPWSIERAATQAGFPAGPLTLLDEVTLTLPLSIAEEAVQAGVQEAHPGLAVLRTMVEAGRTGKSAGKGFFDWEPAKTIWPGLAELFSTRQDSVSFTDAQERLLFIMAVESVKCVEEGVLRSAADANIGSIFGIGFPPPQGGVLQFVDAYPGGVAGFVARADALADAFGERFRPSALLREATGTLREAVQARAA